MEQMISDLLLDQLKQAMIINFEILEGILSGKYELKTTGQDEK